MAYKFLGEVGKIDGASYILLLEGQRIKAARASRNLFADGAGETLEQELRRL